MRYGPDVWELPHCTPSPPPCRRRCRPQPRPSPANKRMIWFVIFNIVHYESKLTQTMNSTCTSRSPGGLRTSKITFSPDTWRNWPEPALPFKFRINAWWWLMLTFMIYKDNAHEHDVYDDGQEDDLWVHGEDAVLKSKFEAPPKQGGHIECILMMEMREPEPCWCWWWWGRWKRLDWIQTWNGKVESKSAKVMSPSLKADLLTIIF